MDNTAFQAHFNLTTKEQGENFGQHGFTGDIKLEFEIAQPDENEEVILVFEHYTLYLFNFLNYKIRKKSLYMYILTRKETLKKRKKFFSAGHCDARK